MFATLVRLRVRMWWNVTRRAPAKAAIAVGLTAVLGWIAAYKLVAWVRILEDIAPGLLIGLLPLVLSIFLVFPLLRGFSIVLQQMFLDSDLDLMMASPIRLGELFAFKSVQVGASLIFQVVVLMSLLAVFTIATGAGIAVVVVGALGITALFASCVWLAMIAVMLGARVVPPKRLRSGISVVGALIGGGLYLMLQLATGEQHSSGLEILEGVSRTGGALRSLPSGWVAQAIANAEQHEFGAALMGLSLIVGLAVTSCWVAFAVFRATFVLSWGRFGVTPARAERRAVSVGDARSITFALIRKDLLIVRRDPTLLSSMIFPLVFVIASATRAFGSSSSGLGSSLGAVAVVPFILGGALPQRMMRTDGRQLGVIRCAPVAMRTVLGAKFVAVAIPTVLVETVLAFIVVVRAQASLSHGLVVLIGGAVATTLIVLMNIAISALVTDFANPDARPGLNFPYFLANLGLSLIIMLSVAGLIATMVGGLPHLWLFGSGAVVGLAVSIVSILAMMAAAERRLARAPV